MSALSMTTAVTAKVAIAGKSVVSKRNVAAAPSKRGQLVRARSFIFLLAFSARCRRGAILFLAALCGIFSKILARGCFAGFYANGLLHGTSAHLGRECVSVAKESFPWSRSRARMRFSRTRLVID
jgi:hypothetical protein